MHAPAQAYALCARPPGPWLPPVLKFPAFDSHGKSARCTSPAPGVTKVTQQRRCAAWAWAPRGAETAPLRGQVPACTPRDDKPGSAYFYGTKLAIALGQSVWDSGAAEARGCPPRSTPLGRGPAAGSPGAHPWRLHQHAGPEPELACQIPEAWCRAWCWPGAGLVQGLVLAQGSGHRQQPASPSHPAHGWLPRNTQSAGLPNPTQQARTPSPRLGSCLPPGPVPAVGHVHCAQGRARSGLRS